LRSKYGTSLLVMHGEGGAVMAADDMIYVVQDGLPIPSAENVRKVFAIQAGNVAIGSGHLCFARCPDIGWEYKVDDWVAGFIRSQQDNPPHTPHSIATALYEKLRVAFQPIESLIEQHLWNGQVRGERLVSFTTAGYADDFSKYECFELAIEFDRERDGLRYIAPFRHDLQFFQPLRFGEDQAMMSALRGQDPEVARYRKLLKEIEASVSADSPELPPSLQRALATVVALIKLEAYFNKQKVGRTVNAIVINRAGKTTLVGQF
jgi:hypothetical protein